LAWQRPRHEVFMKKFLFDLFPIIVFFIAYKLGDSNPDSAQAMLSIFGMHAAPGGKPGIFLATLVAILATFLQVGWVKLRGHKVEIMLWVSLFIIVIFGGATLYLQDENFIKWKPTVLYWIFAAAIFGAAAFGKNLIRTMMNSQMELPDVAWRQMNLSWGGFFAFMGIANLWVANHYSTDAWVNFKLYGSVVLMLVFVVVQSLMLSKYIDKEESK
jgi:intracellular septation protein